jgi:hypothetical protein
LLEYVFVPDATPSFDHIFPHASWKKIEIVVVQRNGAQILNQFRLDRDFSQEIVARVLRPQVGEESFVLGGIELEQLHGNYELQKRIAKHFQSKKNIFGLIRKFKHVYYIKLIRVQNLAKN